MAAHPALAYGVLFLAALLEAVPVVGSFVPGSTVILSLSALIATGDLAASAVATATVLGAVLGDGVAYATGRRYPQVLRGVWPLRQHPELVRRSEETFRRYGNLAVFVARFLPPVRALVPVTAGTLGMPPRRFFPFNFVAIACWAPAHIIPGWLAGTAYAHAGAVAGHLLLPVLAGIATVLVLVLLFRRYRERRGRNLSAS